MSKRENDANNIFRPSDSPLTEYEKEQIALRKNLEPLKAERIAREAANSKNDCRSAHRADATERSMKSAAPVEEKCQACDGAGTSGREGAVKQRGFAMCAISPRHSLESAARG